MLTPKEAGLVNLDITLIGLSSALIFLATKGFDSTRNLRHATVTPPLIMMAGFLLFSALADLMRIFL